MRASMKRALAATGTLGALALGSIACGGPGVVDKDAVATSIASKMQEQGVPAQHVNCPADLPVVPGQLLRCEFTAGGQPVDAVVSVTSVDGGTARYDIHTEARPVAKPLLDRKISELVSKEAGVAVDAADCAGDLPPQTGKSVSCDVTAGGETAAFTVTVTSIDGGLVNFAIKQV